MKINMKLIYLLFASLLVYVSCEKTEEPNETTSYFLSEIRPNYFEHLNFNSEAQIDQIDDFLVEFTETYDLLKEEYDQGAFTSSSDKDYLRLAGMYYSFYITAIVRAVLDDFIEFEDIVGDRTDGFFSGLVPGDPNFEQKELVALMNRSQEVATFSVNVNGFNDKTYATYMVSRQINERVRSVDHFNNPMTQDSMLAYVNSTIQDFDFFPQWNILMSMLSFSNYADSVNTFQYENFNILLENVNERLSGAGNIPQLAGRHASVLGPMFMMDLNMKKMDWIIRSGNIGEQELTELGAYIFRLDQLVSFIDTPENEPLLDSWGFKDTFYQRVERLNEIKAYRQSLIDGTTLPMPELATFFATKDFLHAYQCYNCHKDVSN